MNFFFIFISFPFPTFTFVGVEILPILIISSKPSITTNCEIIIWVFISCCNTHSIFISPIQFFLGNLHFAFSPDIKTISNSISFFGLYSERSLPFIIIIPVLTESVVSIEVALNSGMDSSSGAFSV